MRSYGPKNSEKVTYQVGSWGSTFGGLAGLPQLLSPLSEVPQQSSNGAGQASEDFPSTIFEFPALFLCLFQFGDLPSTIGGLLGDL